MNAPSWATCAGLQTPVLSRMPTPTGVFLSAVCEYLWAEMLQLAGSDARDGGSSSTGATHVKSAVSKDAELCTMVSQLGMHAEFDVSSSLRPASEVEGDLDVSGASEFPLFQAKMNKLLATHAWFSKPEEGSELRMRNDRCTLADWCCWSCNACYCFMVLLVGCCFAIYVQINSF